MAFRIELVDEGRFRLEGHFLASEEQAAARVLDALDGPCTLDLTNLEYISSAGLRLLIRTQARLLESGHALRLAHPSDHVRDLFAITGLDQIFAFDDP